MLSEAKHLVAIVVDLARHRCFASLSMTHPGPIP